MKLRQSLTAVLSVLLILGLTVGLPVLLLAVGGNPLPEQLPTTEQVTRALTAPDDGRLVLALTVLLGWACWVLLGLAVVAEFVEQAGALRGRARRTGPVTRSMPRSLVRPLVASILAVLVSAPSLAATAAPATTGTTATGPERTHATSATGPVTREAPATGPAQASSTHTVQPGDTLWDISAQHLGAGQRYGELYASNAEELTTGPDLIYPGTVLVLPGAPGTIRDLETLDVQVQAGDTLSALAQQHLGEAARWPEIYAASQQVQQTAGAHLVDPDLIQVGWRLRVPTATRPAAGQERTTPEGGPSQDGQVQAPGTAVQVPEAAELGAAMGRHLTLVPAPQTQQHTPKNDLAAPAAPATSGEPAVEDLATAAGDDAPPGLALEAGWLVAGLAGAGGCLAGALWLGLRARRRTQARYRRPGRTVGTPPPAALGPLEQTTQVVGPVAAVSLVTLDRVLKHLAVHHTSREEPVPPLVAARLSSQDGIDVFLDGPGALPDPWTPVGDSGSRWRLASPTAAPAPEVDAPYPLLVTVGSDDTEGTWLLNLEGLHVAITGDQAMGADLARHVGAGMLLNPWSCGVQVDCLGLGQELEQIEPGRMHVHAPDEDEPLRGAAEHLATTVDRARRHHSDTTTARVQALGQDPWPARAVLAGASTERTRQLASSIVADPRRAGTAIVVTGTPGDDEEAPSLVLQVDPTGRVQVGGAGLDLVAAGLTVDEATGCAMMCAAADDHGQQPVPGHDVDDPEDLRHYIDQAGGLREPFRHTDDEPPSPAAAPAGEENDQAGDEESTAPAATSVLDRPPQAYLDTAATTTADLDQVAPHVHPDVGDRVRSLDPDLDQDLADWHHPDCRRPRLRLLGPVRARTYGVAQSHSKAFLTEILTYLALHPEGAPPGQLADAVGLTVKKARDYVSTVRSWLGTDPRTGQLHLPWADDAVRADGVKLYRLTGVLVDTDLFKRLHARGVARGPEGLEDLVAALQLVQGQPFDQLRPGGWGWLFEHAERIDQYLVVGIGTVAHLVTVHSLDSGDLPRARWAAQVAKKADPHADTPNLDLAAVAIAEGRHHDSATLLRTHVTGRSDDDHPPPDLPDRTAEILRRHPDWLAPGSDAAAS